MTHEIQEERQRIGTKADRSWYSDPIMWVGHILTTLILAGSLLGFILSQNTKLETVAVRVENIEDRIERRDQHHASDLMLIRNSLTRLEDKLDRVAERNNSQ